MANTGDPPAAEQSSGDLPPPLPRAKPLSRPIRSQRLRLDLGSFKSEPQDLDLTADILRYWFGLEFLLKSPPVSSESTRGPAVFKSNYKWAKNFARTPLSFLEIEPAVQPWCFCELDPRSKVYLCFSPCFLQKTPETLFFLQLSLWTFFLL